MAATSQAPASSDSTHSRTALLSAVVSGGIVPMRDPVVHIFSLSVCVIVFHYPLIFYDLPCYIPLLLEDFAVLPHVCRVKEHDYYYVLVFVD